MAHLSIFECDLISKILLPNDIGLSSVGHKNTLPTSPNSPSLTSFQLSKLKTNLPQSIFNITL